MERSLRASIASTNPPDRHAILTTATERTTESRAENSHGLIWRSKRALVMNSEASRVMVRDLSVLPS